MAALTDDATAGTAAYLASTGTTFFATSSMARSGTITRAQNHMASDGARRGAAMGWALAYVLGGESVPGRAVAGAVLGTSLLTTTLGYNRGRLLTDGEAHGATAGSTLAAALTAGAIGMGDGWSGNENRGPVAAVLTASVAGYPLGLRWVRRSPYAITAGDVSAVTTAALVGALAASTVLSDESDGRLTASVLTGGMVMGTVAASRLLARPYEFTETQAQQLGLGATVGALVGVIPAVLAEVEDFRVWRGWAPPEPCWGCWSRAIWSTLSGRMSATHPLRASS